MADTKLELPLRLAKQYRQRRFDAPHPPQLSRPFSRKHWSIYSSRVAAELRDDKSGFDTVPVGPRSGAYRFGPPSKAPDYPYHLEKYGMQVLEAAGFLNHQNQGMSGNIDGRLAFEYWRNRDHNPDLQKRIHPVWRLAQSVNLTPHQYSLMTPALLLASAILDDPVTLNYFYALAMPIDSMDTVSHVSNGLKADCKIMKIPDVLPEGEDFWTFMKLDLATLYIRDWGFEDGLECFAYTARYMDSLGEFTKGSGP